MQKLTEKDIRESFANASRGDVSKMTLPDDWDAVDWESLDYFGWTDPKIGRRAYIVVPSDENGLVGVLLQQAQTFPTSRAQCNWCRDVRLPNDVVFYGAKRVGAAGRKGDTVGILICQRFECSKNVRNDPPLAYEGFDQDAARAKRIAKLRELSAGFVDGLVAGR